MDWLTQQAQSAGPFVAVFCLLAVGALCKVIMVLWDQLKFEREEHRKAEVMFATASKEIAVSHVALSRAVDQLESTLNGILPSLLQRAGTTINGKSQ